MNFAFLTSVRFWKLFLVALAQFLAAQKVIPNDLAQALTIWFGGSVIVSTVDKAGQNIGGTTPPASTPTIPPAV